MPKTRAPAPRRRPAKVHLEGNRTIGNRTITACNSFLVESVEATLDSAGVTCGHCRKWMERKGKP